ncbi:SCO3242 family prenyltransferase [Streptomyces sp. NPDC004609]|uniref:SCO3242 family prenyltransferase n=1 Tax=Streptomyces sp. NPDC004609 TaxID=3364704 RepID=UPI003697233F
MSGLSGRAPGGQGAAVPDSGQGSGAGHEAAVRSAPDDRREPDPVRSSGGGGGQEVPGGPPRDYGRDPAGGATTRDRLGAWAELLRVSALFTVPGDALAGAAALGVRPGRGTALAIGTSLCLYEAGMALNDWADRDEDAIDRPHRPIPSGRITPRAALTAAAVLTATGLTLASRAGRPALAVATALAATVWSYDLHLKHTKAGPAAMAAARSLDLLLGATATASRAPAAGRPDRSGAAPAPAPAGTGAPQPNSRTGAPPHGFRHASAAWAASAPGGGSARPAPGTRTVSRAPAAAAIARGHGPAAALPAALALGAHTYAVTSVSRHETQGGSTGTPLAALAATLGTGLFAAGERTGRAPASLIATALAGAYIRSAGKGFAHAALNPSPPLTQRAVGGGIRAMIPLQAALAARAGNTTGTATALALTGLVPLARALARKVSLT